MPMTLDQLEHQIATENHRALVATTAKLTETERAPLAKHAAAIAKELVTGQAYGSYRYTNEVPPRLAKHATPKVPADGKHVELRTMHAVACLATYALCEPPKITRNMYDYYDWYTDGVVEVLAARRPAWLASFIDSKLDKKVEDQVIPWGVVRRLVQARCIPTPTHDGYTRLLGSPWTRVPGARSPRELLLADAPLLEREVWQLFEIESRAFDTIFDPSWSWVSSLAKLADEGRLDRARLVAAATHATTLPWKATHRKGLAKLLAALGGPAKRKPAKRT